MVPALKPASVKRPTPVSEVSSTVAELIFPHVLCFFFFQAEDGIRDHCVTGVQTCALPISFSVLFGGKFVLEMRGNVGFGDASGIGAGRMEKGAAGAAGPIDNFFVEEEIIVGVVVILLADHVDQASPAVPNADDLIAFTDGAKRNASDTGIKAGNVTAPC